MAGRRDAVLAHRDTTRYCNFFGHFRPRQNPAVARFGALAPLDLDQFDLRVTGVGRKAFVAESAIVMTAVKVARSDFPDQVTTVRAVVRGERAFKATQFGPFVEGQNRVGRQRAKTQRRDIEDTGVVGLGARLYRGRWCLGLAANPDPEVMRGQPGTCHRVVDPLITLRTHIEVCAKRLVVGLTLGALESFF